MTEVWIGAAVMLAAAGLDYALVRHQLAVSARAAGRAAAWSVACYLVGLVGLAAVVRESLWYAAPECAGLALGSYLAVRRVGLQQPCQPR